MKLNFESPAVEIGARLVNLLILNFCWILGCLPVVTAGTSCIAAFSVTLKITEDRESTSVVRAFWSAWRENLLHGILLTLILAMMLYGAWMNVQLFDKLDGNPVVFLLLGITLLCAVTLHFLYIFPLEARYRNRLLPALHNARRIFARFFLRSLSLTGILILQALLFLRVAPVLSYVGFFCGPILAIYTVSRTIMPVFRKLEADSLAHDGFTVYGDRHD